MYEKFLKKWDETTGKIFPFLMGGVLAIMGIGYGICFNEILKQYFYYEMDKATYFKGLLFLIIPPVFILVLCAIEWTLFKIVPVLIEAVRFGADMFLYTCQTVLTKTIKVIKRLRRKLRYQ